jgi:circadian clock protein KaiB
MSNEHRDPDERRTPDEPDTEGAGAGRYVLRLYVAGATPSSAHAIDTIQEICRERLDGPYDLEVVDIFQMPEEARLHDIVATPTLVKSAPGDAERVVGDFSLSPERVLAVLSLVEP